MKPEKIYISGPISGQEEKAEETFYHTEKLLIGLFDSVINPFKLNHDHDKSWESYMKVDIKALLDCDSIYMLNGWQKSRGAVIEYELAKSLGIKIYIE